MNLTPVQRRVLTEIGVLPTAPATPSPTAVRDAEEAAHLAAIAATAAPAPKRQPRTPSHSLDIARVLLAESAPDTPVLDLIGRAAVAFGVKPKAVRTGSRVADVAAARGVVCWVLRQHGWGYHRIGVAMGRNHSTVIFAVRRVEAGLCGRDAA